VTFIYRTHAIERMAQRDVATDEVRDVVTDGETIEAYPDDEPYPSRLVVGWSGDRPLHVLVADDEDRRIVMTVYEPDPDRWSDDFRTREDS